MNEKTLLLEQELAFGETDSGATDSLVSDSPAEPSPQKTGSQAVAHWATLDTALTVGIVLSILLAPLRFGELPALRPTALVFLPCALCLVWRNLPIVAPFVQRALGMQCLLLVGLLALGHLLGNDRITGFHGDDYSILSIENLLTIPLVFTCGYVLGWKPSCRLGLVLGLGLGLAFHIISVATVERIITYRSHERASGTVADPNILLLYIIPVYFLWRSFLVRPASRWLALVFIVPVVWATLHTLSRAGLAALASGMLALLLGSLLFARTARERRAALGTLVGIPVLLCFLLWRTPDFVEERIAGYTARTAERIAQSGSLLSDRLMWLNELEAHRLADHVLRPFGMGYDLFQLGSGILPHNTFVDVYIIAGPLAFVLFGLLFWRSGVRAFAAAFREAREGQSFASVHLFAFVLTLSLLLFSLSVLTWKVNWLLLGIASGRLAFVPPGDP